ncbi:MAG: 50S ribosomal protein L23 [Candidatus Portnoybacteria bacterium CG02_land_8_20_14_3_00_45_8]|uniref:Large ribosomal subunit protein uL23 n=1 Tax=Candidatus Portnoybacteria bacterium CG02_land_8_20_14_3_00_45_8 TaxID=1974807 RepID=A0A2M7D635_9BACT|nr:MAG: 50S ribosomal protein L23 [Candidatus Portnoybacteria bacterium CG02_land_8_20_14_3_00_45_8]
MGLLNKFKKIAKKKEIKPAQKKETKAAVLPTPKTELAKVKTGRRIIKREFSTGWHVLLKPWVTEKSARLTVKGQYIFKVATYATKNEIKKAVQDFYGVAVVRVNIINLHGKKRQVGRFEGVSSSYKKAVVTLAPGEKLDIIA